MKGLSLLRQRNLGFCHQWQSWASSYVNLPDLVQVISMLGSREAEVSKWQTSNEAAFCLTSFWVSSFAPPHLSLCCPADWSAGLKAVSSLFCGVKAPGLSGAELSPHRQALKQTWNRAGNLLSSLSFSWQGTEWMGLLRKPIMLFLKCFTVNADNEFLASMIALRGF